MKRNGVLAACFLTVFISYAVRYGYGILLPAMLPALDISKAKAGVIYSSFFIAYTVVSPVLGYLGDRYGTRRLLTIFVLILGGAALFMGSARSLPLASLYFTFAGIGSAACFAPAMALAQRWIRETNRGRTLAMIEAGSAIGIIFTSLAVPLIVTATDWTAGWRTLGWMGIGIGITNFLLVRDRPASAARTPLPEAAETAGGFYRRLAVDQAFWRYGLAYLLTGFSIIIPFTFLSTFGTEEMGLPFEQATRLVAVIGAGAVAGKLTLGPLSDRIGRTRTIMGCALLIALGCLGMALGKGLVLILPTLVFSLGYGAVWPMYAAAASDFYSKELSGSVIGLWVVFLGVGSTVSPVIAGWLADVTGSLRGSFGLAAAAAVGSLLLLAPLWRSALKKEGDS